MITAVIRSAMTEGRGVAAGSDGGAIGFPLISHSLIWDPAHVTISPYK